MRTTFELPADDPFQQQYCNESFPGSGVQYSDSILVTCSLVEFFLVLARVLDDGASLFGQEILNAEAFVFLIGGLLRSGFGLDGCQSLVAPQPALENFPLRSSALSEIGWCMWLFLGRGIFQDSLVLVMLTFSRVSHNQARMALSRPSVHST